MLYIDSVVSKGEYYFMAGIYFYALILLLHLKSSKVAFIYVYVLEFCANINL